MTLVMIVICSTVQVIEVTNSFVFFSTTDDKAALSILMPLVMQNQYKLLCHFALEIINNFN